MYTLTGALTLTVLSRVNHEYKAKADNTKSESCRMRIVVFFLTMDLYASAMRNKVITAAVVCIQTVLAILFIVIAQGKAVAREPEGKRVITEGEVKIGATLTAVTESGSTRTYTGFGFGLGANLPFAITDIGILYATFSCNISLGSKPANSSFDLQTLQVPLGLMLKIGEDVHGGRRFIGGAIGGGMSFNFGPFDGGGVTLNPYISADVILAIFDRGSLKVRYLTMLGNSQSVGATVTATHTIHLIASTEW